MKLTPQETYKYFYEPGKQGNDVKIERTCTGNAYATSEAVGDIGPFTMCFDVATGRGKGQYTGTYLEEYAEGEIPSRSYAVTFKHNKPEFINHTVKIKVRENEDMLEEAIKAAEAETMIFAGSGYNNEPIHWEEIHDNQWDT